MAKFNLPDFYEGFKLYDKFFEIAKEHSEILRPNTEFSSIFGIFPGAIWNGGGTCIGHNLALEEMKEIIDVFNNKHHIPLRFTFTNPLLEERHCYDTYSNLIAQVGHNGQNEILTSSRILENYLRKNYPNYKYCKSIIGTVVENYDEIDNYYLMVMRRERNNNWEFLDKIDYSKRHKFEFLCNDPCPDNCPRIYSHYRDLARAQLAQSIDNDTFHLECSMKQVKGPFPDNNLLHLKSYISRKMIDEEYVPKGFIQFKLSGRFDPTAEVMNLVNYCIKPEYMSDMVRYLLDPYVKKY